MLTRRIIRFIPAVLAVTVGAALLAGCRGHHCRWHSSPEEKAEKVIGRLSKELDLTADQKSKVEAIKNDILARKGEFRAIHDGLHGEILGQMRSEAVDTAQLNRSLDGREARMHEMRSFLVGKFAEFHAVLTPEQRGKLAAKLESHRKECK